MDILGTPLEGLKVLVPRRFEDERGYFLEAYSAQGYASVVGAAFVQDNLSHSRRGVLRGLHYQYPDWQGKLVYPITGEIFDVAVDIRADSSTFGQWYGLILSAREPKQLYIPPGFAHGFCVLSETADVTYKCTAPYNPACEFTLAYNDPSIGIDWPVATPLLSFKDRQGRSLASILNVSG